MPRKTKLERATDDDGYAVVPKEAVQPVVPEVPVLSEKTFKQVIREKKPQTERQKQAVEKLIERNRIRWEEKRAWKEENAEQILADAKAKKEEAAKLAAEEAKRKRKEQEEALIAAGTHVRVKVAPKRGYTSKAPPSRSEETASEETEMSDTGSFQREESEEEQPVRPSRVPKEKAPVPKSRKAPPPPSESETETDGEYKSRERVARREVKKNLQALRSIDEALVAAQGNPYAALIASRWK